MLKRVTIHEEAKGIKLKWTQKIGKNKEVNSFLNSKHGNWEKERSEFFLESGMRKLGEINEWTLSWIGDMETGTRWNGYSV